MPRSNVHIDVSRALTALAALLVFALLAYGCGGGGDPEPLSKTAFLKQGNAICVKSQKERDEAGKAATEGGSGSNEEELETFISQGVTPSIESMTSELGDLGVPEGDEDQVEAILDEFDTSREKLEDEPQLVLKEDPFTAASKMAKEYGLTECAI